MKVVATQMAFYNGVRVRPGAVVEVPDTYKASWFAKLDTAAAKAPKGAKAKDETKALSELTGEGAKSFADVHKGDIA